MTSRNKKIEAAAPTVDEWTMALQAAMLSSSRAGCDGVTTPEIVEITGWNDRKIRRCLKELINQGIVVAGRKRVTLISGVTYPQVCYCLKKGNE